MSESETEFKEITTQLRWIILFRVCFAVLLTVTCLFLSGQQNLTYSAQTFLVLYRLSAVILFLSVIYILWLNRFKTHKVLGYFQAIVDTLLVTVIIFITGSYDSIFNFLYLIIIIYSSMLLLQKGSLIIATLSCLLYATLLELEHYGLIHPFQNFTDLVSSPAENQIIFRIIIMILACFAVAALSSILAVQLKSARYDLKLAQEHLKRVEKLETVDELISGIAHEVKNPLASLSGSIQLLHEDTTPGSYEDKLMQIILRETERLKEIVNDIKLFSKPSKENAEHIELVDIIEEIVEFLSNDPKWKDRIQFQVSLNSNCQIFIDPSHFKQILFNLLINSAQAIENTGKVSITLKPGKGNRVYLIIKDTGCGIPEKKQRHIFDPFFTTKSDGTGLGLPIIHRLIDTYNGMIDFESKQGEGTVFTILFKK